MRNAVLFTAIAVGVAWTCAAHADPANRDAVVRALRDEAKRSTESLGLSGSKRPYYVAYRLDDWDGLYLDADFGAPALLLKEVVLKARREPWRKAPVSPRPEL